MAPEMVGVKEGHHWVSALVVFARVTALAVLSAALLVIISELMPQAATTRNLVADLRSGRTHAVYWDTNGTEVYVRWSTGPLAVKAETYRFPNGIPGAEGAAARFKSSVIEAVGPGRIIDFQRREVGLGFGGLRTLVVSTYVTVIPWAPLRYGVIATVVLLLVAIATTKRRRLANNFVWLWLSVLTGFGFWAYLLCEPQPLVRSSFPVGSFAPLTSARAVAYTAAAAVSLLVIGFLMVWLTRQI